MMFVDKRNFILFGLCLAASVTTILGECTVISTTDGSVYEKAPNGTLVLSIDDISDVTLKDETLLSFFDLADVGLVVKEGVVITRLDSPITGGINCDTDIVDVEIEVININESPPTIILPDSVGVPENLNVGDNVVEVVTNDPDGAAVTLSIENQIPNGYFDLHESWIVVKKSLLLEQNDNILSYNLTIRATSLGPNNVGAEQSQTAFTNLTIFVEDIDNNPINFVGCISYDDYCMPPIYSTSVSIGSDMLGPLMPNNISTFDNDMSALHPTYAFVGGEPVYYSDYFAINPTTGAVLMLKPVPVGFTRSHFRIVIQASNGGTVYANLIVVVKFLDDVENDDAISDEAALGIIISLSVLLLICLVGFGVMFYRKRHGNNNNREMFGLERDKNYAMPQHKGHSNSGFNHD